MLSKTQRSSRRNRPSILAMLTSRNVVYKEGVPRSVVNIEKVYEFVLVAPYVSSSLSAGGLATSTTLDPYTRLNTFSRWAAVFRQYFVTKIIVVSSISTNYSSPTGVVWQKIEENNAVPNGSMVSEEKAILYLTAPQDQSKNSATITWVPRSSEDLTWIDTGSGQAPCFLKTYGDTTNTLTTGADSSTRVSSMVYYHIAFRYLV